MLKLTVYSKLRQDNPSFKIAKIQTVLVFRMKFCLILGANSRIDKILVDG